eukprot:166372_1
MEIIDDKTYKTYMDKLKSAHASDPNTYMQQFAKDWAKRIRNDNERVTKNNSMTEDELALFRRSVMDPYQNYATHFYDEDLRKQVKITREFLPKSFTKPICIQAQRNIDDIVRNIRKAFEINHQMAKLHAKNNVSIQHYIHGTERLCKQTIITLIASFNGITNFINYVNKGIHHAQLGNYDYDQVRLTIVVLKHFFAYQNILKKIVTTHSIFESFCQLWLNAAKWSKKLLNLRNRGAIFPALLPNDKYENELLLLDLSCLFLRTSYCWLTPTCNTYIIKAMKENNLLEIVCQWLKARTANWDYNRVTMLQAFLFENSDDKYQQVCHQTNYIFQCLMNAIHNMQLKNINGAEFLKVTKDFAKMMVENRLSGAMMQLCMSDVNIQLPDGKIQETFPGIKFDHLKKMRKRWKYKFLECQSSNCNVTFKQKKRNKLKKCKSCKMIFYCSRTCQKFDWKYKHRFECDRIR